MTYVSKFANWNFYTFKVTLKYESSGSEVVRDIVVPAPDVVTAAVEVGRAYSGEHYEVVKVEWKEG